MFPETRNSETRKNYWYYRRNRKGKSTVSKFIEELGFPVYDSDFWAKELVNVDENLKSRIIELLAKNRMMKTENTTENLFAENVFENQELL